MDIVRRNVMYWCGVSILGRVRNVWAMLGAGTQAGDTPMTANDAPILCFGLGVLLFAIALYRFCTYDRADNGGVRGDVPYNPTPIHTAEDDNPRMIITNGRMTRVIEREDK